jgi:hypothetical protein
VAPEAAEDGDGCFVGSEPAEVASADGVAAGDVPPPSAPLAQAATANAVTVAIAASRAAAAAARRRLKIRVTGCL